MTKTSNEPGSNQVRNTPHLNVSAETASPLQPVRAPTSRGKDTIEAVEAAFLAKLFRQCDDEDIPF